jgi:hypothetical protein
MLRFICWFLAGGLTVGYGPKVISYTISVAEAAVHAHLHDQMSYAKFTQKLLNAKPRAMHSDQN